MASSLKLGFMFDLRNPPPWHRRPEALYSDMIDVVVETERLGFGGAWVPEHHLAADDYIPSPMVMLAALAARTSRITIGSGIVLAPLYDPVRFAEDCAVLDILADGRLEMGLAIGYRRREYDAFGLDFGKRGARFDEFLQIVRALWAGETVNFEGEHYTVKNARITPLSSRRQVHLNIGGFVEKAIDRAAKYGDGYFGNPEFADIYMKCWTERGRNPEKASMLIPGLFTAIARDPDAAMEELAPHYHYMNEAYSVFMREDEAIGIDNAAIGTTMDLDAFKASGIFQIWTPEEAVANLRALQDKMPLRHYALSMPPGLSPERFLHYAGVIASDVLPAFA